jgi:hypothetical protein
LAAVTAAMALAVALEPVSGETRAAEEIVPAKVQETVRKQQDLKRQYQDLIRIMNDISRRIESADPKTAALLAGAAQKADAAMIAEDMDKVVALLQSGLAVPAEATQAQIVIRLRKVLEALRSGDMLEWRVFLIEEMKAQMARVDEIVLRQKKLERQSRVLFAGGTMRTELEGLRHRVETAQRTQSDLLVRARNLSVPTVAVKFANTRKSVLEMIARANARMPVLKNPAPSADQIAENVVGIRAFLAQAADHRTNLRSLLNAEGVRETLATMPKDRQGSEIVDSLAKAVDEFDKSAKGFVASNIEEAHVALSEALACLNDAMESMDNMICALPGAGLAGVIADGQKRLAETVVLLAVGMKTALPEQFLNVHSVDENGMPIQLHGDLMPSQDDSVNWDTAQFVLGPLGASVVQEREVEKLRDWRGRLDAELREVDRRMADPRFPEQTDGEGGIVRDLNAILEVGKMCQTASSNVADLVGMLDKAQVILTAASGAATEAVGHLRVEKPCEANVKQNEVIRQLSLIKATYGDIRASENRYPMQEQLQARVERMMLKQKIALAETKIMEGRLKKANEFSRSERLRMQAIARDEAGLQDDADILWELANVAEVKKWGWFSKEARILLQLARSEIRDVTGFLEAMDPGPATQEKMSVIMGHLKAILSHLKRDFAGNMGEDEHKLIWDGFHSIPVDLPPPRSTYIGMLAQIQEEIGRRTAGLHALRKDAPGLDRILDEIGELRALQEQVVSQMTDYAEEDAKKWRTTGKMGGYNGHSAIGE